MAIFRNTLLKKEDMKKMAAQFGGEMDTFLSALNGMFSQLHTILAGGLEFGENVHSEIRVIAVASHQVYPIIVKHSLGRTPRGVIILRVEDITPQGGSKKGSGSKNPYTGQSDPAGQQSATIAFTPQVETLNIDSFGALDPTHKYSVTVMIV